MVGLVDYGSSDEEDASSSDIVPQTVTTATIPAPTEPPKTRSSQTGLSNGRIEDTSMPDAPPEKALDIGPVQGPARPTGPEFAPQTEEQRAVEASASDPQSVIRNMTLPPFPNFDIPPSPPGSPPPGSTEKIAQFLALKKKGTHFNDRLESSSALRNPALLEKLRKFAGISEVDQYSSALPDNLKDSTSFPEWAYKEELEKAQREFNKKKMGERAKVSKDAIEFAPGRVE